MLRKRIERKFCELPSKFEENMESGTESTAHFSTPCLSPLPCEGVIHGDCSDYRLQRMCRTERHAEDFQGAQVFPELDLDADLHLIITQALQKQSPDMLACDVPEDHSINQPRIRRQTRIRKQPVDSSLDHLVQHLEGEHEVVKQDDSNKQQAALDQAVINVVEDLVQHLEDGHEVLKQDDSSKQHSLRHEVDPSESSCDKFGVRRPCTLREPAKKGLIDPGQERSNNPRRGHGRQQHEADGRKFFLSMAARIKESRNALKRGDDDYNPVFAMMSGKLASQITASASAKTSTP